MVQRKQEKLRGSIEFDKRYPNPNLDAQVHGGSSQNPRSGRSVKKGDSSESEFRAFRLAYKSDAMETRRELLAQNLAIGMETMAALKEAKFKVGKRLEPELVRVEFLLRSDAKLQGRIRELVAQRGYHMMKLNAETMQRHGLTDDMILASVVHVLQQSMAPATYDRDGILKSAQLLGDNRGLWDKSNAGGGTADPRLIALAEQLATMNIPDLDRLLRLAAPRKLKLVEPAGPELEHEPDAPSEPKTDLVWKTDENRILKS